ncbi:ribonuclease T1 [Tamaricihabitans halophyticus]|uniref:Ribonuclease T1 n=2 Tax=Tamaricihabitans halophyticus TaxID=1262583 RepID=A0A4R2QQJ7_9PSEU|nr:ribonuclease T1 [Tamaricihabitans halophyticus]
MGRIALALLIAVLGAFGFVGVGTAEQPSPSVVSQAVECGDTSGFEEVTLSSLPQEATDTVELIKSDGPFPYPEDGTVFQNREGLLPDCDQGYYHEYTVDTPGSPDRGARRIVTGSDGEYFYTEDHYASFVLVNINS